MLNICNETNHEFSVPQMQQNKKENSYKLDEELAGEIKAISVTSEGRKFSKVVAN